jgi:hypothetical protein
LKHFVLSFKERERMDQEARDLAQEHARIARQHIRSTMVEIVAGLNDHIVQNP